MPDIFFVTVLDSIQVFFFSDLRVEPVCKKKCALEHSASIFALNPYAKKKFYNIFTVHIILVVFK